MPANQIDEDDRQGIQQLRKLIAPYLTEYYDTDFNLLRWLQGHPGPVECVAEKLKVHLKARSSLWEMDKLGTVRKEDDFEKHWPYKITGLSGRLSNVLVMIEQTGQIDFAGMLNTYSVTDILMARLHDFENMLQSIMELEERTGEQASVLFVMDLTGLKYDMQLFRMILGPMKCVSEFMSEHYVEVIKYFLIVNAPAFMNIIWNFTKPLLPIRTRDKVRILSSTNWREEILEFANADALPDKWNTPNGPKFTSFIDLPIIFRKDGYYNQTELPENLDIIYVRAGESNFVTRYAESGDRISWFLVADAQFAFAIFRSDEENGSDPRTMETIYPSFGWLPGPTLVPIKDIHTIQKSGYYKLQLINDRVWFHTLKVFYSFDVFANSC
uniref:CRAL-TRIO domain-containing protein n=1 Tax=Parascaris univalens TaxID=6257 RepID=A0A915API9_PARUN